MGCGGQAEPVFTRLVSGTMIFGYVRSEASTGSIAIEVLSLD